MPPSSSYPQFNAQNFFRRLYVGLKNSRNLLAAIATLMKALIEKIPLKPYPPAMDTEETATDSAATQEMSSVDSQSTVLVTTSFIITPTTPSAFSAKRYHKQYPKDFQLQLSYQTIAAGLSSSVNPLPAGWQEFIHPEGQPYYLHNRLKIVTESCVRKYHELLEKQGEEFWANSSSIDWSTTELFTNVNDVEGKIEVYMINHQSRTMFYPWQQNSKELGLAQAYSTAHMTIKLEESYWNHVEHFPMHIPFPEEECKLALGRLLHGELDGLTSPTSTFVFSPERSAKFRSILNADVSTGYKTWVLARINQDIYKGMFHNLYGQPHARLDRLNRIYPIANGEIDMVIKYMIKILFFGLHKDHRTTLQSITVDGIVNQERWKDFLNERVDEWQTIILWSTVFWTVGLGFLQAVPQPSGKAAQWISASRGLMLSSVFCAMLSTAASLCHYQRHRRCLGEQTTNKAISYLGAWDHKEGFLALSIVYALPLILFVWAAVFAALATLFYGLNFDSSVLFKTIVILLVTVWGILAFRLFRQHDPLYRLVLRIGTPFCFFFKIVALFFGPLRGTWRGLSLPKMTPRFLKALYKTRPPPQAQSLPSHR